MSVPSLLLSLRKAQAIGISCFGRVAKQSAPPLSSVANKGCSTSKNTMAFWLCSTSISCGKVALEFHVAASFGNGWFFRTHCAVWAGGITFGGTRSFNNRMVFCFPFLSKLDMSKVLRKPRYWPVSSSSTETLTTGEFSSFRGTSVSTWFTLTDKKLSSKESCPAVPSAS